MTANGPAAVVVLAAGGGTRMKSAKPKMLHTIGGRTLLEHTLAAAAGLEPTHLCVVVGHARQAIVDHAEASFRTATFAVQEQQQGTGHAVLVGLRSLPELAGVVVITNGDVPLQTTDLLQALVDEHVARDNAVTVLSAELDDPFGYGRVLRARDGQVTRVVEERDATDDERRVQEISSGMYACDGAVLAALLNRLGTDNAQGEMYLPDIVRIAHESGYRVGAMRTDDVWQTEGVNTMAQLARLGRELNRRVLERWMAAGVEVIDPESTWVDVTVELAPDVTLRPGVQLHGLTTVGVGAVIGPDSTLSGVSVGAGSEVVRCHGSDAVLAPKSKVGPFAYLRPGTRLGDGAKIGAFVETKNAVIGDGAKVPHLSYVGDATIGEGTNIGAGTIFANYDGVAKHRATVGRRASTGANNTFVAPVDIGDGASTGAGTVVRRDVPVGALAVSTGPQRNIAGWVERKRPGSPAAEAASSANAATKVPGKVGSAAHSPELPETAVAPHALPPSAEELAP